MFCSPGVSENRARSQLLGQMWQRRDVCFLSHVWQEGRVRLRVMPRIFFFFLSQEVKRLVTHVLDEQPGNGLESAKINK